MMVWIISFIAGLGFALSFSWAPESFPALMAALHIACLATALQLVHKSNSTKAASQITAVFCLAWFSAGLCWLYISMHYFGGMPSPMAAAAVVLFAAYLSSFYVLATFLCKRFNLGIWGLVFAWTLGDLLRGYLFTGFPWLAIGYGQVDSPISSWASVLGVYGMSAITLALAACIVQRRKPEIVVAACLVLSTAALTFIHSAGNDSTTANELKQEALTVSLHQGNIAQNLKFDPKKLQETLRSYAEQIDKSDAQLVVLPETAWTTLWTNTPTEISDQIRTKASKQHIAIGMPEVVNGQITNSLSIIQASGELGYRYRKHHLVPFGEFIPFGFDWFVKMMNIPLGDFARGSVEQAPLNIGKERIAFNICYEDLFGEEIAVAVQNGATILVNISNLAWFGNSHALFQHLQIARTRAMETKRPMLRSTNTGTTAYITPDGKVIARLPIEEKAVLNVSLSGNTAFTVYLKVKNWAIFMIALVGFIITIRQAKAKITA